jgi:hypothetical protein
LKRFKTFKDFYPYYLQEHSNANCRKIHFIGTSGVIALLILFFFTGNLVLLALLPVLIYGLTWIAHVVFEKNTPTFFRQPLYRLLGDFRMFWDILTGKISVF